MERTDVGKGPVGFINSVLYEHPEVMTDIVNGTNPGCGSEGFRAAPGWDPVSAWDNFYLDNTGVANCRCDIGDRTWYREVPQIVGAVYEFAMSWYVSYK